MSRTRTWCAANRKTATASAARTTKWMARSIAMIRSTTRSRSALPRSGSSISSRDGGVSRVGSAGGGRGIHESQRTQRYQRMPSSSRATTASSGRSRAASVPISSWPRTPQTSSSQWKRGRKRRGFCVPGGLCIAGMLEEGSVEVRDARGGVLILGGGFAGTYVPRLLGDRGATIVSRENFMLYPPLLPEAASGTLEPRHTVVPLRVMCPHAELLLGDLVAVDLAARIAPIGTDDGEGA